MAAAPEFCPYVGLQPFTEEDRPYFFGREREIRLVGANLLAAKLTVLYGESGVGKSSLLMAGVVPGLRTKPRTAVVMFRDWQRADALPLLKSAVVRAADDAAGRPAGLDAAASLDDLLAAAGRAIAGTTLVLLDQFEEYFLYYPAGGAGDRFDAELARAVNRRDVNAGFVLSIREDSLSKLDRFRARIPTVLANPLRIRHLRPHDAREAICRPLEVYNRRQEAAARPVSIEPALVDALVEQTTSGRVSLAQAGTGADGAAAAGERVEAPYLQLVLTRLWEEESRSRSPLLRAATLASLGGAARIVRTHLDQVMSTLVDGDQALCAEFFDRLVTPSGSKIACRLDDLKQWAGDHGGGEVERVVAALAAPSARILRAIDPLPGQPPQYEIFHDVLAAGVLDWRSRHVEARERERLGREAAEHERAEAEARALAIERDHARQTAVMLRRLKLAFVLSGLLLLVALAAGAWAWQQARKVAEEAERVRTLQEQAEQAKVREAARIAELERVEAEKRAAQAEQSRQVAEGLREDAERAEKRAKRLAVLASRREQQAVAAQREAERQKALADEQRQVADQQRQRAEAETEKAAAALGALRLAGAQDILNSLYGAELRIDGRFGPRTAAGLEQLQQDAGLTVTGKLDEATLACVNALSRVAAAERKVALRQYCTALPERAAPKAAPPTAGEAAEWTATVASERSRESPLVRWVQAFLNARIDAGLDEDGLFGGQTRGGVERFQALVGLPETGLPDDRTLSCMRRVEAMPADRKGDALSDACRN